MKEGNKLWIAERSKEYLNISLFASGQACVFTWTPIADDICDKKKGELYMDLGIIGGADGPTKVYIASDTNFYTMIAIVILCIVIARIIIWRIKKKKSKY